MKTTETKGRILHIDDEQHVRQAFRDMLHVIAPHIEVVSASGNDEALEILRASRGSFDFIIHDLCREYGKCLGDRQTGSDSGKVFYDEILRVEFPQIRVVWCAGWPDSDLQAMGIEGPFLAKPVIAS